MTLGLGEKATAMTTTPMLGMDIDGEHLSPAAIARIAKRAEADRTVTAVRDQQTLALPDSGLEPHLATIDVQAGEELIGENAPVRTAPCLDMDESEGPRLSDPGPTDTHSGDAGTPVSSRSGS